MVSMMPAAMNTMAYSLFLMALVNFVRRTGIDINDKLPMQTAKQVRKKKTVHQ
jgi:hypothetical protein